MKILEMSTEANLDTIGPHASNTVIVREKHGSIRICIHFRNLNDYSIKGVCVVSKREDALHLLLGTHFFLNRNSDAVLVDRAERI